MRTTRTASPQQLLDALAEDKDEMVKSLCSMLRIRAVGPENQGEGEAERGEYLASLAKKMGFDSVTVHESKDQRVPTGKRPNIIVTQKGTSAARLWVVTHMDTVPEGDINAWKSPPFEPTMVDQRIYARGSEDNGQELIASLYGLRALVRAGIRPELTVGLVFVSDEEHGNTHGIDFLIDKKIFKKGDVAIVPDHGHPDGSVISVVEKSIAWIGVEVVGRQTHGSTPDAGVNAFEVGARFMIAAVDKLRKKYSKVDPLFDPPGSTFAPTRCEANGPNINTIPGRQVFAFDFRVLPEYELDDVMGTLRAVAKEIEVSSGAEIKMTYIQRADAAPRTSTDSGVVKRLTEAVLKVRGVNPTPVGIGGGTCAAPFRRLGVESAVWSTIPGNAHDANEYCLVENLVSDAKVYALLFAGKNLGKA